MLSERESRVGRLFDRKTSCRKSWFFWSQVVIRSRSQTSGFPVADRSPSGAALKRYNQSQDQSSPTCHSGRVSNAALANAASVLSSKIGKNIRDGGQRRIINPKSLGSAFLLCRRAGIDAALVKTDFFFAGAPPIENQKSSQKIQTLRWHLAKVAFHTVQCWNSPQECGWDPPSPIIQGI